jgi:hypothetical protein
MADRVSTSKPACANAGDHQIRTSCRASFDQES